MLLPLSNDTSTTPTTTPALKLPPSLPATPPASVAPVSAAPVATAQSSAPIQMTRAEYQAKYGTPPPTPAAPAAPSAPVSMTTREYQAKYNQNPDGTPLSSKDTINANLDSGKIKAPDAVIQDFGEAAKQTNDALLSPWSPLGWVNNGINAVAGGVASVAKAVVDPLATDFGKDARAIVGAGNADKIASGLDKGVSAVEASPLGKAATAEANDPAVTGDLGAVGNVANLAGTTVAAGEGAKGFGDLPKVFDPASPIPKVAAKVGDLPAISSIKSKLGDYYVNSEKEAWAKPATTPAAGFKKVAGVFEKAAANGHDIPTTLVNNGIKLSDNIEGGKYATADTADAIREDAGKTSSELLRPSLQVADYTTPKTPVADIVKSTVKDIEASHGSVAGDTEAQVAKAKAEGAALARKYPDGMSLTDMHDEKITYAKNGGYKTFDTPDTGNIKAANRAFGRVLGDTVVDKAPEGLKQYIDPFNAELAKQYQAADYLDELNTKKVPQGIMSKIAKTAAKVAGAAAGESLGGGLLGGVGGYHIGGMVESMIENMPNPVRGHFLNTLEMTNPKAFDAVKSFVGDQEMARLQRRMLPAPKPLGSPENPIIPAAPTVFDPQAPNGKAGYNTTPQLALPPAQVGAPAVQFPISLPAQNPLPEDPLNPTRFPTMLPPKIKN